ncbi:MAG: flagellar hook-associated protein FlgL [bacterium]
MRVTNNMLVDNVKRHLQNNMGELDELNQKLSSGKQFQKPSEAPIQTARSLKYSSFINSNEQYEDNLDESRNWLRTTETSLKDAGSVLQRSRELTVQGANDSLSLEDRENIAKEIDELKQELTSIGNTKLGDRYIFGGQQTKMDDKVFEIDGEDIVYNGDNNAINREIGPEDEMKVNVTGEEAFTIEDNDGNEVQTMEVLEDLRTALDPDNPDNFDQKEIENKLPELDQALEKVTNKRAEMGAKINRVDMRQKRFEEDTVNLKELKSTNEDVDIAEVITDLKMEESVYRASLASGARSMQPSLVDFLQ